MGKTNVLDELRQVPLSEVGAVFQEHLREVVKESFLRIMLEETSELCGAFYHPDGERRHRRGGSAPGHFRFEGRKIPVKRPRVVEKGGGEAKLVSYSAGKSGDEVKRLIVEALSSGVSSREVVRLFPESGCSSSTSACRLWATEGLKRFEELRGRELGGEKFVGLMIDGVRLSSDTTAVIALGIVEDGRKLMLDFEIGGSENKDVCDALLNRLSRRGFKESEKHRLLVVLDGSDALRKSVLERFDDPVVQRCQIHKEKNIRFRLAKRHHPELARLFKRLRNAEGAEAAREALNDIRGFLSGVGANALSSLDEAGESLIAVQTLGCPFELHTTFLSTNIIENSINNIRRKTGRVKRWRAETNQAEKWLAFGMLEAERGFKRVKGYKRLEDLLKRLERPSHSPPLRSGLAASRRPLGRPPLRGGEWEGEAGESRPSSP